MRTPRVLVTLASLVAIGALPAAASATQFCVPTAAACPGPGTVEPDLQSALALADDASDADVVHLAAGTFIAPTSAGFSYALSSGAVQIVGAGNTGAGRTTLTTPAGAARVLRLRGAAGSSVSGLEIVIADDVPAGQTAQLDLLGAQADHVKVVATGSEPNAFNAVWLSAGASFAEGTVELAPEASANQNAVVIGGPGASVTDAALAGRTGVAINSAALSTTLARVRVTAASTGIANAGSTTSLESSIVQMVTSTTGCALSSLDQPGSDGELDVDGVTAVTDAAGTDAAVCASVLFAHASSVRVTNSILRGFGTTRSAFTSGGSTGAASIDLAWSGYDPAANDAVTQNGTGAVALTPASHQLGATNSGADPQFVAADDLHLQAASPLIDRGDPATAAGLDLDGSSRLLDGDGDCTARRDMGAYELAQAPCNGGSGGGGGGGGGDGWPALSEVCDNGTDDDLDGKVDGADPDCQAPGSSAGTHAPPGTPPATEGPAGGESAAAAPPPAPVTRDRLAPRVTRLRVAHGAVTFRLSERGRVQLSRVDARGHLRRVRVAGRAGANRIALPRHLRRGRYVVRVVVIDPAGNRGVSARVAFRRA